MNASCRKPWVETKHTQAGTKGLEEEFGAEATRSVIEDVKSGRGSADRTYFEKAPEPEASAASAAAGDDGYDD